MLTACGITDDGLLRAIREIAVLLIDLTCKKHYKFFLKTNMQELALTCYFLLFCSRFYGFDNEIKAPTLDLTAPL